MASTRYKRIFFFRFVSYFSILISIVWVIALAFPIVVAEFTYRKDQLLGVRYVLEEAPALIPTPTPTTALLSGGNANPPSSATTSASFVQADSNVNIIRPVSTDYGIVIEKINANARVISDVDPGNETQYAQALTQGVAEALGSTKPGENGNLFIFSHSADGPFNISRYNAVFYLLKELDNGDKIVVFHEGKRYDYIVYNKLVTDPTNIDFLTNRYDKPVLTLQTCDPPGTLANRLIVQAKLQGS
jgi:LPXTG-site transpeptidase (sortase) family protein